MADNSNVYFPPASPASPGANADISPASASPAVATTNTFALIGFILSLSSIITLITAIPGLVLGHLALKQIRDTGEDGHGMAVAAVTIGWVVVGLGVLTVLIVALVVLVPLMIVGAAYLRGYSVG